VRPDVFEEKAARTGTNCGVHVLVQVEGGQHENPRRIVRSDDLPGRLDPIKVRHANIHEDDIGPQLGREAHRFRPVVGFTDNLEVGSRLNDQAESVADERLVVGDQDANAHASGSVGIWTETR
jgi:hypothetical protein